MTDGKPLIVQSDLSILADAHDPAYEEARDAIAAFASLEKSPEHVHTYRMGALSLWNASSAGLGPEDAISALERWSRYELPADLRFTIRDIMGRFGSVVLSEAADGAGEGAVGAKAMLRLSCASARAREEIAASKRLMKILREDGDGFLLALADRGTAKLELMRLGRPARDEAPLVDGEPLPLSLRSTTSLGLPFALRPYQAEAVRAFTGGGAPGSGYGLVVLPCGSGKTVVGMAAMAAIGRRTLILTTNVAAARQWIGELLDKTDLRPEDIGEYSGFAKDLRPVTVATYQILTWRPDKASDFPHFGIFRTGGWGLVIYDEAHLLPAPVFRVTAEIQAVRRLGLTATLVREDGCEEDVFGLVGPKRYDVPWKDLEGKGFIAQAWCREIRVALPPRDEARYAASEPRAKHRIAAENPRKLEIAKQLVEHHADDPVIVIGQYLDQLGKAAKELGAPLITGATPELERERVYEAFRRGEERVIVVSKVANFAIDLPDASVAIQLSGTFGSRQEEAQRLGRILRPKRRCSFFYTIVSRYTVEEEFQANRRVFLAEQGYRYSIEAME